jgi:hypothetical protein
MWLRQTRIEVSIVMCMTMFDCLYEEGTSHPKMMSVGLHCRIAGRPVRSRAVERFLRYTQDFPGVWCARRDEIVKWWLKRYPR